MKFKIDCVGDLYIERAGKFRLQYCPFSNDICGDKCPLFDKPSNSCNDVKYIELKLCHKTLVGECIDERDKE